MARRLVTAPISTIQRFIPRPIRSPHSNEVFNVIGSSRNGAKASNWVNESPIWIWHGETHTRIQRDEDKRKKHDSILRRRIKTYNYTFLESISCTPSVHSCREKVKERARRPQDRAPEKARARIKRPSPFRDRRVPDFNSPLAVSIVISNQRYTLTPPSLSNITSTFPSTFIQLLPFRFQLMVELGPPRPYTLPQF